MAISTTPTNLVWYKSKIVWGGILAVLGPIAQATGLISNWDDESANQLADALSAGLTGIGAALAVGARLTQKAAPPITLTK
jgi:hypothetical protein